MAPSTVAAVSNVWFVVPDCVWALRQLQWAQRVDEKAMRGIRCEAGACYRATVTASGALQCFCLRSAQLPSSVLRVKRAAMMDIRRKIGPGDGQERGFRILALMDGPGDGQERGFRILALMDAALAAHGHASAIVALRTRRTQSAAKKACTLDSKREEQTGAGWKLSGRVARCASTPMCTLSPGAMGLGGSPTPFGMSQVGV